MSEWIGVKERLPEPEVYVLIATDVWVAMGKYKPNWNMGDGAFSDDGDCGLSSQPTHWMYLPEPPRGA